MTTIHLLADRHIPFIDRFFTDPFAIDRYDPDDGPTTDQLARADAMLIRTVTKVDEAMIRRAPSLNMVCSATAGYDHLNFDLLASHNIQSAWAAGCNARSVAEYVGSTLIVWAEEHQVDITELSVGIIGEGHAGSAVRKVLKRLGCNCLSHDPPRQERESDWSGVTADEVLACDILTFHTGLDQYPDHPTRHWLNREKLEASHARLIFNAARGGIVDENALRDHQKHHPTDLILDVWEEEPRFSPDSARSAWLATPHIAGYSRQSKFRGTQMSAEIIHRFFGVESNLPTDLPPESTLPELSCYISSSELIRAVHPVFPIHENLQKIALESDADKRSSQFLNLRVRYPSPDEWQAMDIPKESMQRFPELAALKE